MRQVQFSLDNLRLLDFGKIGVAFQSELERCVKDCIDRPGEDKARVVNLKFLLGPKSDPGHSDCDRVQVQCEITSGLPKRSTRIYEMLPSVKGNLTFHPDLPDDPDGSTLYDPQARKEDDSDE